MVLVEEVPETEIPTAEDSWTDSSSSIETSSNISDDFDDDDDTPLDETLYERFIALKDIVPPTTRSKLVKGYGKSKEWTWWSLKNAGTLAWVLTTSALLVGLPLALAIEDEARVVQQEREMQMQSAGQQQLLGGPQSSQPQGVLPPGF